MTATATRALVTGPGVFDDVPEDAYHSDAALDPALGRSLSVTDSKKLLPPSCPALFKHYRDHGQKPKPEFDFGTAAHTLVLGKGDRIQEVEYPNWTTNAAKKARDEARAAGRVPLLSKDLRRAEAVARSVMDHPVAGAIFSEGRAEVSLYEQDTETGVMLRRRVDWVRDNALVDLKTVQGGGANPTKFGRTAADYGYHIQDAAYTDTHRALTGEALPFLFVLVEKVEPYLVSVVQLDDEARSIGRALTRQAISTYHACELAGYWPGYDDIEISSLPTYYTNTH